MFEPNNVTELSLDWSGDPYGRYRWAEQLFEAYTTLLLGRCLQRQNRASEAQGVLAMAQAMGQQV